MKNLFRLFFLSSTLLITSVGFAQDFLGYSASEYAGVTAIDIQPANLADNRFKFDMTLFGTHVKAYNNYVGINTSTPQQTLDVFGTSRATQFGTATQTADPTTRLETTNGGRRFEFYTNF